MLDRAETALAVRLDRASVVYGESGATKGFRTHVGTWVRIERRRTTRFAPAWVGLEAASVIEGVAKPGWFQSVTWADPGRGVVWRADELELITAPMVGELRTAARARMASQRWREGQGHPCAGPWLTVISGIAARQEQPRGRLARPPQRKARGQDHDRRGRDSAMARRAWL